MKKSQTSAGSIAVFIVLIALFMVLYLLFVPPEERARLLGENKTNDINQDINVQGLKTNTLLTQTPGLLKPFDEDTSKHEIDSIQLYLRNEPLIDDLATSLTISKTIFKEETKELRFNIQDLSNLNKASLFFFVGEAKGNLIINFNNIEIFNDKASGLKTITLPEGYLKETNTLLFKVNSPSFFGKNTYTLKDIKVREEFELTNTKEERTFVLSASETGDAELNFFAFCNQAPVGSRLRIFLNREEIFNNVLGCISSEKNVEIKEEDLKQGTNNLLFEIDKGDFLLNDINLKVELEEGGSRTYKFSITEKQMDDITASAREVKMIMNFKDDENKRATINVNGNEFSLETTDLEYERFITSLIREGNNFIRIVPGNEFTVDLLEIKII